MRRLGLEIDSRKLKKVAKIAIAFILGAIGIFILFIIAVQYGAFGKLQSKEDLQDYKNATASTVLSEDGELIGHFFSENRTNISFEQIPLHLHNALIATEDVRFYKHKGVDIRSLARVFVKTILISDRSSGGGSTITQQLAKNMFGRTKTGFPAILVNKTKEAILANRIEKIFTKEEIITLYLNTVSFGENVFGIGTASLRYFNKDVESLTVEESAVLIGMLKANSFYNPRLNPENATVRRNVVLSQMGKYGYLEESETDSISNLSLVLNYTNFDISGPADYFLYQVKKDALGILNRIDSVAGTEWNIDEDGLIITTTLNLALQNYANNSFRDHLSVMQKKLRDQYQKGSRKKFLDAFTAGELKRLSLTNQGSQVRLHRMFDWSGFYTDSISVSDSVKHSITLLHAGLIAIDPETGAVKAWVGGIDFKTQPYDQVLARRQLASTFKPILFAAAFEEGIEPCQFLNNDSVTIPEYENWTPENFDHTYGGKYSLAGALAHSMNVPTFNLYTNIGFQKVDSMWKNMGFLFPLDNTPSLALGTAEANIEEVALAYASFANGGLKISPYNLISIKTSSGEVIWENEKPAERERILNKKTSLLIGAILQKAVREGTGASMAYKFGVTLPLAGKTGTSQDYSDAWFTAFNPKLVIVSRVGASSPAIHFYNGSDGSGSGLALPLVAITLKMVQENQELRKELIAPFPELPAELQLALECPDFKEDNIFDKFLDIFKKDQIIYDDGTQEPRKKRSLFRRIFKRR